MKIAFVYDAIYPWIKGGAEKRIYDLGKRLAANGNEVHIFGVKCGMEIQQSLWMEWCCMVFVEKRNCI